MRLNPTHLVWGFAGAAALIGAAILVSWLTLGRSLGDDVTRMMGTMFAQQSVVIRTKGTVENVTSVPLFQLPKASQSIRFGLRTQLDLQSLPSLIHETLFRVQADSNGVDLGGTWAQEADSAFLFLEVAPEYADVNLSSLKGKWIRIPSELSLAEIFGLEPLPTFDAEDWAVLKDALSKIELVHVERVDFTKVFDGDTALRYTFVPNKEGLVSFLTLLRERQHKAQIDLETYRAIQAHVRALPTIKGEMWIGRTSFLLHELTLHSTDWDLDLSFSELNKPLVKSSHENSTSILNFFQELGFNVAALPGESSLKGSITIPFLDFSIPGARAGMESTTVNPNDTDGDGLRNQLELFYGTNPLVQDTDGDGVSDGAEVTAGRNPNGTGSLFGFGLDH